MAETQKVKVLQIDAGNSKKTVGELRNEIKALKNELLSLDEGTEEYNKTLAECADKMHDLKEINEQTAMASSDFGDRISNVSRSLAGMTGAVSVVTGALGLFGIEAGNDTKLMKMLVSAMSMTSGITAVEAGVKSIRALTISLKASIVAAGGLGNALKALMLSNPFTAILTGVVALGAALAGIVTHMNKVKEASDEAFASLTKMTNTGIGEGASAAVAASNQLKKELEKYPTYYQQAADKINGIETRRRKISMAALDEEVRYMTSEEVGALEEIDNEGERYQALRLHRYNRLADAAEMSLDTVSALEYRRMAMLDASYESSAARREALAKNESAIYQHYLQQATTAEATAADEAKKADEKRKQSAADKAKAEQDAVKALKDAYALDNAALRIALERNEVTQEEYYKQAYEIAKTYYENLKNLTGASQADILSAQEAEIKALKDYSESLFSQIQKPANTSIFEGISNTNIRSEIDDNKRLHTEYQEWLKQLEEANFIERERLLAEFHKWEDNESNNSSLIQLERERRFQEFRLENIENSHVAAQNELREYTDAMLAEIERQVSEGILTEEQGNQRRLDLQVEYDTQSLALVEEYIQLRDDAERQVTENERLASEMRVQLAQDEQAKKKSAMQNYLNAANQGLALTSQLFSTMMSNLDTTTEEGFEQNKKYQRANATISFLQGLISAWSSAMQLGPIAGPIAGAALTALLTAIYAANLSGINSTTMDSSGSAANTNYTTIQTLSTPVSNVRQTTTSQDEIDLEERQQRVYVLASDIEEAIDGRRVNVSNATF